MPPNRAPFSKRRGFSPPKEIVYRDELPLELRFQIFNILRRYTNPAFLWERIEKLINPYGSDALPAPSSSVPISKEEGHPQTIAAKQVLASCSWFHVYDIIEDIFGQLDFYETELMDVISSGEEDLRAFPFQQDINDYFLHGGIGWQLVNGEIVARGDEHFESAVNTAANELSQGTRPTAARRLQLAISALSARPKADTSGAVAHATSAMECVLGEVTGKPMTLGEYLKQYSSLFSPALKKGLEGVWGYASNEGARHGKEGIEPTGEEAEFVVHICAAVCTLLNRKHPK